MWTSLPNSTSLLYRSSHSPLPPRLYRWLDRLGAPPRPPAVVSTSCLPRSWCRWKVRSPTFFTTSKRQFCRPFADCCFCATSRLRFNHAERHRARLQVADVHRLMLVHLHQPPYFILDVQTCSAPANLQRAPAQDCHSPAAGSPTSLRQLHGSGHASVLRFSCHHHCDMLKKAS